MTISKLNFRELTETLDEYYLLVFVSILSVNLSEGIESKEEIIQEIYQKVSEIIIKDEIRQNG